MSEILKIFSAEQQYNIMRDKIIADNVGLTNFNVGSRIRSILEAVALLESTTGLDYLEGLRRAIPVALYDGFGFKKKAAMASYGYLKAVRKPAFTLHYTGIGTSALVTNNALTFDITVTGAGGDNVSADLTVYDTVSSLVTYLDGLSNYSCSLIKDGNSASENLYYYSGKEIIGSSDFLDNDGLDIMTSSAGALTLTIPQFFQVGLDNLVFQTIIAGSILAGEAHSADIPAECASSGVEGNIAVHGIDTSVGKGFIMTFISGIDYATNDSAFSGGSEEETDLEQSRRFQVYVKGLSGSTVYGLQSAALSVAGVKSVTVKEAYPKAGQVTLICDNGSGFLSSDLILELNKVIDGDVDDLLNYPGARAAGITVNIQPPSVIETNVVIMVYRVGVLADEDEIKAAVQTAIENYINTRQLGQDVVYTEMVALAKKAHPAIYDVYISVPASNVSINDEYVARTGAGTGATVTVSLTTYTSMP